MNTPRRSSPPLRSSEQRRGDPVMSGPDDAGALEIRSGHPTDAELAALALVVVALRRGRPIPHQPMTSTLAGGWRSYWHTVRTPVVPGREAWRSSFRI
ncbi:MAG: acyl-CoA carboxylase subunit epsilon [Propionibacteriaceae bacterium]|nr:acyl-CoA carboxylase subunit epsilon [Propionibacteriaceae bacterium]